MLSARHGLLRIIELNCIRFCGSYKERLLVEVMLVSQMVAPAPLLMVWRLDFLKNTESRGDTSEVSCRVVLSAAIKQVTK